MYTLFPYILLAFKSAMLCGSMPWALAGFVLVHFMIIRPIGWGIIPDFHADVYYTLIFWVNAMFAFMIMWVFGLPGLTGIHDFQWRKSKDLMRVLKVLFLIALTYGATTIFEYAGHNYWGFFSLAVLLIVDVLIWVLFRKGQDKRMFVWVGKDHGETRAKCMTPTLFWMNVVFDVVVCALFIPIYASGTWWQFYVSLVLLTVPIVELIAATILRYNFWGSTYDPHLLEQEKHKQY